ncbi:SUKH-3 domain-containing protein [Kitasatospora sp. YST-16]|uniref:SUKH-3 domain-containing protein n=1 Tax=Kitasatospora sp. YST-16 TaxID=2998080 RepID=UPI002284E6FD|nr:SUKH-3 domain-containing protein [Kitasatospora sp. YST-16]WAL73528.1 SUKH-3 domain-containing protein [Kitasatospora sp. YST-16]WNW39584.1 SUKH-3 domain-containing protein [Streptomyces sp. Li-HN-5-13]
MEPTLNAGTVRTQPRFPADVAAALKQAGWHPGRWEIRQAELWADALVAYGGPLEPQHAVFPAAIEAWAEFGGLAFDVPGPGDTLARTPFLLDPRCGLHAPRTLTDLGRALDTRLAPLGEELYGQALLAIDEQGRVYSLDHTGEWFLGDSVDRAIGTLVLGRAPHRLRTAQD